MYYQGIYEARGAYGLVNESKHNTVDPAPSEQELAELRRLSQSIHETLLSSTAESLGAARKAARRIVQLRGTVADSPELQALAVEMFALLAFAEERHGNEPDAQQHRLEVRRLVAESTPSSYLLESLSKAAMLFNQAGDSVRALECWHWAEALTASVEVSPSRLGRLHANIGLAYRKLGDYSQSLKHSYRSLDLFKKTGELHYQISALQQIGGVLVNTNRAREALPLVERSLSLASSINEIDQQTMALNLLASVLIELDKPEQALEHARQCCKLCMDHGLNSQLAGAYNNLGGLYKKLKRWRNAQEYYERSLSLYKELGDSYNVAILLLNIGLTARDLGEQDKAQQYIKQSMQKADAIGARLPMFRARFQLFEICKKQGAIAEALHWYEQYHNIRDQVFNEEQSTRVAEMEARYKVEQVRQEAEIYRNLSTQLSNKNKELEDANAEIKRQRDTVQQQAHKIEGANAALRDNNAQLETLNSEKNEFLGIAAHDLKNPLGPIKMIGKLMENDADSLDPQEIREIGRSITTSAQQMFDIITNLLDINRIEQGKVVLNPAVFDLLQPVRDLMDQYRARAEAKQISIQMKSVPELPAFADINATRQVLDNLISNAIKYSPFGKTILIRLKNLSEAGVVRCEVQDEGPGIAPDEMSKLFGKFARLSAQPTGGEHSTGLGLSIVKRLVEAMNGKVWCESVQGRGATFIVEIPAPSTAKVRK